VSVATRFHSSERPTWTADKRTTLAIPATVNYAFRFRWYAITASVWLAWTGLGERWLWCGVHACCGGVTARRRLTANGIYYRWITTASRIIPLWP